MGQDLRHPHIQLLDGTLLIHGKKHNLPITKEYILKGYNDVFSGIGTLPGYGYHIRLMKDYEPVPQPPRSVPVKLKPAYKGEPQQLCSEGVITPVWKHTEWTNSIVPLRKVNGKLKLCLDHKNLYIKIERNKHYPRSINNLSAKHYDSKYFTMMDAKSGYWVVQLDKVS